MTPLLLRSNISALRVLAASLTLLLSAGCSSGDSFRSTGPADGSVDGEATTSGGAVGGNGSSTGAIHGSAGGASGSGGVHGPSGGASGSGDAHGAGGGASGSGGIHGSSGGASGSGGVHGSSGGASGSGGVHGSSGGASGSGGVKGTGGSSDAGASGADAGRYLGPSVGSAKSFAALAYSAITTANISSIIGEIGVSAGAVSTITGFDASAYTKYGMDSLPPNDHRTALAQGDVTALVGNIDPRACDVDYTNVVGGLTGDITLYPGVTCMNSFSADVLLNGHVYLDARGDPNAFFV
ncbi:MAG TPA: ice-binding family protein, partial [Polyangiaceae bacterium]